MYFICGTIILLESAILIWIPWHLSALLLLLYTLRWLDGSEFSGTSMWPAFRCFRAWSWFSPVASAIQSQLPKRRCIYLVTPCATPATLFWGIGIATEPCWYYMVPRWLFWIPLLRDALLWSGAVAQGEQQLLDLIENGVCYALAPTTTGDDDEILTVLPPAWLLDMAIAENIVLCIITVQTEDDRRIHFYQGTTIQSQVYANSATLGAALAASIRRNTIAALGDKTIKAL
jgi:hypothetical protein